MSLSDGTGNPSEGGHQICRDDPLLGWAGGDCAAGGEDLTVTAVAQGRDAAEEMNSVLMGGGA